MNPDQTDTDPSRRIRELEEELARVREASSARVVVTEAEYKGHPVLTFEGSVPRFSLGLTKLRAVQEVWSQVEAFLRRHPPRSGRSIGHTPATDDKI